MSPFALSVLKYSLLLLLYLFVFRAIRSVAVDVSGRRRGARAKRRASAAAEPSRGGNPPTHVLIDDGGGGRPRTMRLSGRLDIGRGEACAIRLQDHYVSEVHARLFEQGGVWHVEDAGSTNGTFLNGGALAGAPVVRSGDTVRVGKTVLELRR